MNTSKAEEFLDLYKQLESLIKTEYVLKDGESPVPWLLRNRSEFGFLHEELTYCREVRNLLSHKSKVNGEFAVQPSDGMINALRKTKLKIENPPRARDVCIGRAHILSKGIDDLIKPTMVEMVAKRYTHIPILDDGRVVGVFSENTLLSYLIDEDIVEIGEKMRFSELSNYLPLNKHSSESFRFVPQNKLVADVSALFRNALRSSDRIGMVFVTNNGKETEELFGIITAWDVAAFL